ncbi:spermatogenesis-associated protein 31A6-like [Erinaceus europaeus]|uniref:Spermatogenesis-associated protein 31A6-like n=1 Tax=Erinaceus europaeus TaxID=9365 RepID=A0A1S3AT17_ERIEU|nr:spermatogenesis-associated protein 31A6-like [Erinaceus europaeus]
MENYLSSLTSVIVPWLSPSSVYWVTDIIISLLCGVGLFYILIRLFQSNSPLSPPTNNRSIKKYEKSPRPRKRSRRRSGALKACRDCLQELDGIWSLLSFLQSRLRKLPNKSSSHPCIDLDPPQVKKPVSSRAHWPCQVHVEDITPTMSPPVPPTLLAKCSQPLTFWPKPKSSSVSIHSYSSMKTTGPGPPEPFLPLECLSPSPPAFSPSPQVPTDSEAYIPSPIGPAAPPSSVSHLHTRALPPSTISQGFHQHTLWPPAPIRIISGLGQSSHPISTQSWWRVTANALSLSYRDSQQKPLSQPPPGILFWKLPTNRQVKAGSLPTNSNFQKLLEILITKKLKLKVWKKKEYVSKDHLNSLKMLKSLDDKKDVMTYQPFCNMKDKSEQLYGPEKPPPTKILQNYLKKKHKQLFWGLPILHSESLLAPVRISGSPLEHPSVLFNQLSDTLPVQIQVEIASHLSESKPLSPTMAQSQLLPTTMSQLSPLAQVQTQPAPALPPSPPQIMDLRESYPTAKNKEQSSLPDKVQNLGCHFLKKQLEGETTSPSVVKKYQEKFTCVPPKLQDIKDSQIHMAMSVLPKDVTSPELQAQTALNPAPMMGQSSQDKQKMRLSWPPIISLEKDLSKGLGKNVGMILKDLYTNSASLPVEVLEANYENSKEKFMRPSTKDPQKRHLENFLKTHLGRKVEQISEGQIPVNVHHSRLDTNHALCLPGQSNSGKKNENFTSSKGLMPDINTSFQLSVLSSHTQKVLEEHLIKLWVRHRWHLPLKILKPINMFKFRKTRLSPFARSAILHSTACELESYSREKPSSALEKPPSVHLEERGKSKMSVSTPTNVNCLPALSVSPAYDKTPTWEETTLAHGPSETPLCEQEDRMPSQAFTHSFVSRLWHSGTMLEANRSMGPIPIPATDANELKEDQDPASRESYQSGAVMQFNSGSHTEQVEEDRVIVEIKEVPAWETHSKPRVMLKTMNSNLWSSSRRSSKRLLPPAKPVVPDPEESRLDGWLRKLELQKSMELCKQPAVPASSVLLQDCETGVLLQDCATDTLLQESQSDVFRAADILASQGCLSGCQSVPSGDLPVSPMQYDQAFSGGSNQSQQKPQKPQDPCKRQGSSASTHEGERSLTLREQERRLAGKRVSQAREMNQPPLDEESCRVLLEKEEDPPESHLRKKMKSFLQWVFPRKDKALEEPLQKSKAASTPSRRRVPIRSRSLVGSGIAEAEALMAAISRILEEKVAFHQGCPAFEFSWYNEQLPSPEGRHFCYGKVLSYQPQRKVISGSPCRHQISSQGHLHPFKNRWVRDKIFAPRNQEFLARPYQYNQRVQGVTGHHSHCPRHCLFQNYTYSDASEYSSPTFFDGTTFIQRRMHTLQRKTVFSHVSTSSTY